MANRVFAAPTEVNPVPPFDVGNVFVTLLDDRSTAPDASFAAVIALDATSAVSMVRSAVLDAVILPSTNAVPVNLFNV